MPVDRCGRKTWSVDTFWANGQVSRRISKAIPQRSSRTSFPGGADGHTTDVMGPSHGHPLDQPMGGSSQQQPSPPSPPSSAEQAAAATSIINTSSSQQQRHSCQYQNQHEHQSPTENFFIASEMQKQTGAHCRAREIEIRVLPSLSSLVCARHGTGHGCRRGE